MPAMDPGNKKAVVAAMLANAGIAVAKFVGFGLTGSSSMLAEGVHSVADSGNQGLLLWGGAAAARAPTAAHPFGYGRERYFWSFVVALILFALGAVFAIYEGVHKLADPHPLEQAWWAVGILGLSIVLESLSFRTAIVEARRAKGRASWKQFVTRSKSPELPVVLLEDLGALVGLVLALAGVLLSMATGDPTWDGVSTIAIGALLGVIAALLAVEMKSLLIGEAADPEQRRAMLEALSASAPVRRVIHLRTQHIGPDEILVGAKVEFDGALDFEALTHAIDSAESAVRAAVPEARWIYVEPDIWTPGESRGEISEVLPDA